MAHETMTDSATPLADDGELLCYCMRIGRSDFCSFVAARPEMSLEEAWATRRNWVFKPAAAYGSKAVYRGDKISKRRLEAVYAEENFLVQRRVDPGTVVVATGDGPKEMKFDVRAYVYRDRIFLLGARVYQGQVTNFRSPGGGFSGICVASDPGDSDKRAE